MRPPAVRGTFRLRWPVSVLAAFTLTLAGLVSPLGIAAATAAPVVEPSPTPVVSAAADPQASPTPTPAPSESPEAVPSPASSVESPVPAESPEPVKSAAPADTPAPASPPERSPRALAGVIASVASSVVADGTVASNGDVVVNGVTLDDSDSNGLIATQDVVRYSITAEYAAGNPGETMTLKGTLPAGVTWQPSSQTAGYACSGQNDTATITCSWVRGSESSATLAWFAMPGSGPLSGAGPNKPVADSFAPAFFDGGNGASLGQGPSLTVVSAPVIGVRTRVVDLASAVTYGSGGLGKYDAGYVGQAGTRVRFDVELGYPKSEDRRGMEGLAVPFSFDVEVPAGVVLEGWSGSGVSASQSGIGAAVHVTATSVASLTGCTTSTFSDLCYVKVSMLGLFVPNSAVVVGAPQRIGGQVVGFDPAGLSGASNYGAGVAPGQEAGTALQSGVNGSYQSFTLGADVALAPTSQVVYRTPDSTVGLFMRSNYNNSYIQSGRVVPGESFAPLIGAINRSTAGGSATNASLCVMWDRNLSQLQSGDVGVRSEAAGSPDDMFFKSSRGKQVAPSGYVVEYAAVDSLAPGTFVCGDAGSGDTTAAWQSDPADVAGGPASVNAVRLRMVNPIAPSVPFGLWLPMARATTAESLALAAGSQMPFWYQYKADETSLGRNSTYLGADLTGVRAATSVSPEVAAGGDIATFTVTPTVIGPAANVNTTATDVKLRLTFDTACVEAGQLVQALASRGWTASVVSAPATGTASCSSESITGTYAGPVVEVSLGDVTAHGSSAPAQITDSSVGGNEVALRPVEFDAVVSALTPQGRIFHLTTVISSGSDTSLELGTSTNPKDRSSWAAATVNTPSTFTVKKQGLASDGSTSVVPPGDTFSYNFLVSNTEEGDYDTVTVVDVLPFTGDPRLNGESDALAGDAKLTLLDVTASMMRAGVTPATPQVLCSTADPLALYTYLGLGDPNTGDKTGGGNPGGGPYGWAACSSLADLSAVTAVKLVSDSLFSQSSSMQAALTVKAPALAIGGHLVNDAAYYAPPAAGSGLSLKQSFIGAKSDLGSSGASLSGTVRRDLNFNGTPDPVTAGSDGWWPAGATMRLLDAWGQPVIDQLTGDPYEATVAADGAFSFPLIPGGEREVRLAAADAPAATWRLVGSAAVTVPIGTTGTVKDLLYQEIVAAPELDDDTATTPAATAVTVSVLGNDTLLPTPQAPDSVIPAGTQVVTIASQGAHGTAVVNPDGTVTFTPVHGWSGTDSFTYSWSNVYGVSDTATVTITVSAEPPVLTAASPASTVIAMGGAASFTNTLWVDAAAGATAGTCAIDPAVAGATVSGDGTVSLDATGLAAGSYTITLACIDSLDAESNSVTNTVTVQALPTATARTAMIGESDGNGPTRQVILDGAPVADSNPVAGASIDIAATVLGIVTSSDGDPSSVTVTVNADGTVTFAASVPGTYTVPVTWFDDLGQSVTENHTVTVRAMPSASGGAVTIRLDGSHTFDAEPSEHVATAGVATPPAAGALDVDVDGTVSFDADGIPAGLYTFDVTFTDDVGQTATVEYAVRVQAPPTADGGTATIGEGRSFTFDADPQTTGLRSGLSASVTAPPSDGTPSVNAATGEVSFDAGTAAPGTYTFTVTWMDDLGQTGTSTYSVTVQAAPIATGETDAVIPVDGSHAFDLTLTPGEHVVSTEVTDGPSCDTGSGVGSVTPNLDGSVVFDGAGVAAGAVCVFEVTFTDDQHQTEVVTFTVTVQPPPTADGGSRTIPLNGSASFAADPRTDGVRSLLAASVTTPPTTGAASVDPATGMVSFDAAGAATGTYGLTVTWTDDLGQTGTSEYTIVVQAPPTATGGTAEIGEGRTATFDADPQTTGERSGLSASVTTPPAAGTARVDPVAGEVGFEAGTAAPGTYTFEVTWTDDLGQTCTSTYTVTVQRTDIRLVKEAVVVGDGKGRAGDTVEFTFLVQNTGERGLSDVGLADDKAGLSAVRFGDWPGAVGALRPGERVTATATYTVTDADVIAGRVTNTATVTGADPDGSEVRSTSEVRLPLTANLVWSCRRRWLRPLAAMCRRRVTG